MGAEAQAQSVRDVNDARHEEYLRRRDELLTIRTDSLGTFDKAVLSLATGSIALSIAFLDRIGTPFNGRTIYLISLSWGVFLLVILANLASYLLAKWNMDRKIEELDDRYRKATERTTTEPTVPPKEKTFWQRTATDACNITAFVLFFLGMLTFTLYIVEIQRHNYQKLRVTQAEEAAMSMKKTGGVTEVAAPVARQTLNEGKTEAPRAVPGPKAPEVVGPPETVTKGLTEAPAAVPKPPATPTPSAPDSGKK